MTEQNCVCGHVLQRWGVALLRCMNPHCYRYRIQIHEKDLPVATSGQTLAERTAAYGGRHGPDPRSEGR